MTRRKQRILIAIACIFVACLVSATWWYHFRVANKEIRFYGRVVDETGAGLPGVTVRFRINRVKFMSFGAPGLADAEHVLHDLNVVTDERGNFALTSCSGTSLQIVAFQKSGYSPEFTGIPTGFAYDQRRDGDNPVPLKPEWRITYPLAKVIRAGQ